MAVVMVIIDGLSDEGTEKLGGKTPLTYAACPHLRRIEREGAFGSWNTCPHGFVADSMICTLTMLGVSSHCLPRGGRAYLETVSLGEDIPKGGVALRCSLVQVSETGELLSATGGDCPKSTRKQAENKAQQFFKEQGGTFLHLSGYRNLAVLPTGAQEIESLKTTPPHEIVGREIDGFLPTGGQLSHLCRRFIKESASYFPQTQDKGSYLFFPWGVAVEEPLPQLPYQGAMVCATPVIAGLGKKMGFTVEQPFKATGDTDTSLTDKVDAVQRLVREYPFVLLHINGCDEAAHRTNPVEKAAFLEKIDTQVIGSLMETKGISLMVTSDHGTSSATAAHLGAPQPFWLWNWGEWKGDRGLCNRAFLQRAVQQERDDV